jgi:hypothetical protein
MIMAVTKFDTFKVSVLSLHRNPLIIYAHRLEQLAQDHGSDDYEFPILIKKVILVMKHLCG